MIGLAQARVDLTAALQQENLTVAGNAMDPLRQIDFVKLVTIHDHEEHFLRTTFIALIKMLVGARARPDPHAGEVTENDVKTALLMLGAAVPQQPEPVLSATTKDIIKAACGFCP